MYSLSLLRLKYLEKMHVKSSSLTLLNHMAPGQVPLRSSLLKGSRFWAGCVGEAERPENALTGWDGVPFSFFLAWTVSPGPLAKGCSPAIHHGFPMTPWGNSFSLWEAKANAPSWQARGSPALGLERKKGCEGCQYWEINPLAGPVVSISCLWQNGRRAQSFCQLTESNHNIFNFYYEKWKHAQIITGTLIYQSPSGNIK